MPRRRRAASPAPQRPLLLAAAVCCGLLGASVEAQWPAAKNYTFGNPNVSPCRAGEVNMTIKGVPGIFCSPPCSATKACPPLNATLAPPGVNDPAPSPRIARAVQADCAIEEKAGTTPTYCAMICDPTSIMPRNGCPGGALHPNYVSTCQRVETVGMCMYAVKTYTADAGAGRGLAVVEGALSASRGELGGVGKR